MATVIKQKAKFLTLVSQQNVSQVSKAASIIDSENIFVFSNCKLRLVHWQSFLAKIPAMAMVTD
jgi:hypothetical protein